ncbi:hypothetical protein ACQ4PT_025732 [Festuca glaucescens]
MSSKIQQSSSSVWSASEGVGSGTGAKRKLPSQFSRARSAGLTLSSSIPTPMAAAAAPVANQAQAMLGSRLCDPAFVHSPLRSSPDTNYSKLKYLVASSVSEACNNSVLLLGPRGCGKGAVLDMVLEDLKKEHPDAISVVWPQCVAPRYVPH